jgi:hypothetical protein
MELALHVQSLNQKKIVFLSLFVFIILQLGPFAICLGSCVLCYNFNIRTTLIMFIDHDVIKVTVGMQYKILEYVKYSLNNTSKEFLSVND